MLGETYFATRLGDIYEYSIIPYKCGKCTSNESVSYFWELCVDVSGNIIFILSLEDLSQNDFNIDIIDNISGISSDGLWKITSNNIHIKLTTSKYINSSHQINHFCIPSRVILNLTASQDLKFDLVRAYPSNFTFSTIDYERGFIVSLNKKDIYFQRVSKHKEIIDFIDSGRIRNALLSTLEIPIDSHEVIENIEEEIINISWFISILSLNLNFVPVVEYFNQNKLVQISIENTYKTNFNPTYIIDNCKISRGIPKAFDNSYSKYKKINSQMDLNTFIGFLVETRQQSYIDLKLATMIMAYEYFLLKYLILQGVALDKIGENVQQKLGQANKYLRFIPKEITSDILRDSLRNPLFHQGEIPKLNLDEKIAEFEKYYDFLIKIFLKVLDYQGKYISVVTNYPENA
ncbi:MAG: hypothetical protein WBB28_21050 [Crinalium sp.]